jgi:hypothetical protein
VRTLEAFQAMRQAIILQTAFSSPTEHPHLHQLMTACQMIVLSGITAPLGMTRTPSRM